MNNNNNIFQNIYKKKKTKITQMSFKYDKLAFSFREFIIRLFICKNDKPLNTLSLYIYS